ncbi:hypothetical protein [Microbacterium sp. NPDC076895]|uniref:hypothetical protein n=1 Tax=Microbacterium sp. NPDC076895 TaxID=3154957 RepID=UPI00342676F9
MSTLALIVAPRDLNGVREVLQDWSAINLIDPFVWTDGEEATTVHTGRARRGLLRNILGHADDTRVVLTVLATAIPGIEDVSAATVSRCERLVVDSLGNGVELMRVRATISVKSDSPATSTIATAGWHNVVLSAEEGAVPERGRIVLDSTTSPSEFHAHIAASLAGALGLWAGVRATMFDGTSAPQSASASIARSFMRSLDSSRVEAELRTAVLSTQTGLPLPRMSAGTTYIEDVPLATSTMEESFWRHFQGMLQGGRDQPAVTTSEGISALSAIAMFFSFLGAALRNAPTAWVRGTIRRVKGEIASTVQSAIFGSSRSAYVVVVGGVLPDGRPASWGEVAEAVDELTVTASGTAHITHEDLTLLWQGYVAAALTLCDAGERHPALAPVEIGSRRGVLRRREDAVPAGDARFGPVPPHVATIVGSDRIAPYDVLKADELEAQLSARASQASIGISASNTLDDFRRWRRQFSSSFAVRVGQRLAEGITTTRSEIAAILERLNSAVSDEIDDSISRAQRKTARALWIILAIAGLLAAIVGVLLGVAVIGLAAATAAFAGVALGWFVSSFVAFFRGQAVLFRVLKELRDLQSQRDVDERNLQHALRDARRLLDAYTQFLRWSELLGAMLADPLGADRTVNFEEADDISGLPPSVIVGKALADAAEIEVVAAELRRLVYEPGWLNPVFGALIKNAHRRLGARGIEFREAPDRLFAQLGDGEHTALPAFSAHLEAHGTDPEAGDALWDQSLSLIVGEAGLRDRLLTSVEFNGRVTSYADFLGGIDRPDTAGDQRVDGSALHSEVRIQAGKTAVAMSEPVTVSRGLSRLTLLRQRTEELPAYEFAATKVAMTHAESSVPPWPGDTGSQVL